MRIRSSRPDQNSVDVWKTRFVELQRASHSLPAPSFSDGPREEVVCGETSVGGRCDGSGYSGGDALDREDDVRGGDAGEEVEAIEFGCLCEEELELGKGGRNGDVYGCDRLDLWIMAGEHGGVEMEEDGACGEVRTGSLACESHLQSFPPLKLSDIRSGLSGIGQPHDMSNSRSHPYVSRHCSMTPSDCFTSCARLSSESARL